MKITLLLIIIPDDSRFNKDDIIDYLNKHEKEISAQLAQQCYEKWGWKPQNLERFDSNDDADYLETLYKAGVLTLENLFS